MATGDVNKCPPFPPPFCDADANGATAGLAGCFTAKGF